MKLKKRLLTYAAISAIAMSILTGCDSAENNIVPTMSHQESRQESQKESQEVHVHEGQGNWEKNGTEHWRICTCGEKIETSVHELDENWICKTCDSEILDFGDIDVSEFDEYGNVTSRKTFSADGELLSETSYEREYNEVGNILIEKYFDNGVLREEDTYSVNEDGGLSLVFSIYYCEDGGKVVREFDEFVELISEIKYNADGEIVQE